MKILVELAVVVVGVCVALAVLGPIVVSLVGALFVPVLVLVVVITVARVVWFHTRV